MAIIHCPECNREVSDRAASCPHCGYPISEVGKQTAQPAAQQLSQANSTPAPQPKKGQAGATIAIISAVIIALAGAAVWYLFFRGGGDEEERLMYENIIRYEQEDKLDSLEEALDDYFDTYNSDAYHYTQLKDLNERFMTERADWQAAANLVSADAVHHFLDQHPDGFFRNIANSKLDTLSFAEAAKEDTKDSYERYISQYPDGLFVKLAESKISDLDHKELSAEEKADVKSVLINHFDALADNDKVAISMTLSHKISSYIGKNDATDQDIYDYMDHIHQSGRNIVFSVKNVQVTKVDAGGKSVYNVQFALEEATYSGSPVAVSEEEGAEAAAPAPTSVKNFTGTAVINETLKITSLVLKQ